MQLFGVILRFVFKLLLIATLPLWADLSMEREENGRLKTLWVRLGNFSGKAELNASGSYTLIAPSIPEGSTLEPISDSSFAYNVADAGGFTLNIAGDSITIVQPDGSTKTYAQREVTSYFKGSSLKTSADEKEMEVALLTLEMHEQQG